MRLLARSIIATAVLFAAFATWVTLSTASPLGGADQTTIHACAGGGGHSFPPFGRKALVGMRKTMAGC